ncbi:gamma-tubulin complex component 2-like [Strongylocentrotus purpuratus]|uniref:Uncharacterized protein n=1 Tax=Strongylocentrotus purpuratus TaxID=7668 RepID=A0A7M7N8E8_STRPU|nr:gamma-tubulin complex component 2-like [Strongylocentrotus purpuratus]
MSEFRVHHQVSELIKLLGCPKTKTQCLSCNRNAQALQMPMDRVVLPPSGSKMSEQEVSELRNQLLSVASSGAASQASEVFKKMMREKQSRKNLSLKLPELSSWVLERPNLTGDFVSSPGTSQRVWALGTLPLGVPRESTRYSAHLKTNPLAAPSLLTITDVSLREVANRILPVCTMYSAVVRFIEDKSSFEYGMVNMPCVEQ